VEGGFAIPREVDRQYIDTNAAALRSLDQSGMGEPSQSSRLGRINTRFGPSAGARARLDLNDDEQIAAWFLEHQISFIASSANVSRKQDKPSIGQPLRSHRLAAVAERLLSRASHDRHATGARSDWALCAESSSVSAPAAMN